MTSGGGGGALVCCDVPPKSEEANWSACSGSFIRSNLEDGFFLKRSLIDMS